MGSTFDEIIRTQTPKTPAQAGLIWVSILVRFDINGNAEVIRAFSKPAKESVIKAFNTNKNKSVKKINIETADTSETLF